MADATESSAEASRKRIEAAGGRWNQVLELPLHCTADDVKQAYRKLVLLHHPDKGGDAATFKAVQQAYEMGMRKRSNHTGKAKAKATGKAKAKAKTKPKPKPKAKARSRAKAAAEGGASPDAPEPQEKPKPAAPPAAETKKPSKKRPKPVPANAGKSKLRGAISRWENSPTTMPDEIPKVTPEELAAWIIANSCVPVDAREERAGVPLLNTEPLSYHQLVTEPEKMVTQVTRLRDDGRKLVLFSQNAERMGICGLLGALLLDVFGFDEDLVCRLDGGHARWRQYVETNPRMAAEEALLVASQAREESRKRVDAAKASFEALETALREHLQVLVDGTWQAEADAKAHLDALAQHLLVLQLEESVSAMFAYAATKNPRTRGPFDKMIFEELQRRFAKRVDTLRIALTACEEAHEKRVVAFQAAEAEAVGKRAGPETAQSGTNEDTKAPVDSEAQEEDAEMGDGAAAEEDGEEWAEEGEEEGPLEEPEEEDVEAEDEEAPVAPGDEKSKAGSGGAAEPGKDLGGGEAAGASDAGAAAAGASEAAGVGTAAAAGDAAKAREAAGFNAQGASAPEAAPVAGA
mmetsp:Transcript_109055/g.307396  ORF Transcript_109055/g.307396 Transcript_109055/m.307396 type:complete len:577 (-) Transcript_109055:263-1993(-)